jgi:hypothetical protein
MTKDTDFRLRGGTYVPGIALAFDIWGNGGGKIMAGIANIGNTLRHGSRLPKTYCGKGNNARAD